MDNMNNFIDFETDLLEFEIHSLKENDCYPFNELCLTIGFSHHICIDNWSNSKFKSFIDNIKKEEDCEFTLNIENINNTTWVVKNRTIYFDTWDCANHLYSNEKAYITDELINKMELLHKAIEEFKIELQTEITNENI